MNKNWDWWTCLLNWFLYGLARNKDFSFHKVTLHWNKFVLNLNRMMIMYKQLHWTIECKESRKKKTFKNRFMHHHIKMRCSKRTHSTHWISTFHLNGKGKTKIYKSCITLISTILWLMLMLLNWNKKTWKSHLMIPIQMYKWCVFNANCMLISLLWRVKLLTLPNIHLTIFNHNKKKEY